MGSRQSPDFPSLIARVAGELEARRLPFMLIGGQAVLLHGQPRFTEDIDITLGVGPSAAPAVQAACEALSLEPLPADVVAFVRDTFVLPALHAESGIRVDFIFSTTQYERQAIERANRVEVGGAEVPFATVEDLILHKLFAGRPRDMEDIVGVVRRKGADIDWGYVERWADRFAGVPGREDLPDRVRRLKSAG